MFPLLMPDTQSLRNWVSKLLDLLEDGLITTLSIDLDNTKSMQDSQLSNICRNRNTSYRSIIIIKSTAAASAQLGQEAGYQSTWPVVACVWWQENRSVLLVPPSVGVASIVAAAAGKIVTDCADDDAVLSSRPPSVGVTAVAAKVCDLTICWY